MEQNKMDASVFNSATWRFDVYLVKTILNSEKISWESRAVKSKHHINSYTVFQNALVQD